MSVSLSLDLQRPRGLLPVVERGEAVVDDEGVPVHREDVRVAVADPRHRVVGRVHHAARL